MLLQNAWSALCYLPNFDHYCFCICSRQHALVRDGTWLVRKRSYRQCFSTNSGFVELRAPRPTRFRFICFLLGYIFTESNYAKLLTNASAALIELHNTYFFFYVIEAGKRDLIRSSSWWLQRCCLGCLSIKYITIGFLYNHHRKSIIFLIIISKGFSLTIDFLTYYCHRFAKCLKNEGFSCLWYFSFKRGIIYKYTSLTCFVFSFYP